MSRVVELPTVNPKSNKFPVTTMVLHLGLFNLFTKWPRHIFYESLFSLRQNVIMCVAVTCYVICEIT